MGRARKRWLEQGCAECREAALRGGKAPLEQIASNEEGPLFLFRCPHCHALWLKDPREIYEIGEAEARTTFPKHFAQGAS